VYAYDTLISGSDGNVICAMDPAPKPRSRDVAWFLYRHHRIGRNEPSAPFLRTSQRVENLRSLQGERMKSNPWTTYNISRSEKAIAAYSTNRYRNVVPETAVCCIYILDRMQITSLVEDLASGRTTFQYCFVTQRLSPSSGKSIDWNVSYNTTRGNGLKKVDKLLEFLTATIFQDDEEESGEASDEGNNTEDWTDQDGSGEDETIEDESNGGATEGKGTDMTDGDDSDKE